MLRDRTSGAGVINQHAHPPSDCVTPFSRTAQKATQLIQPDLLAGSARASRKFQSLAAAGKSTHLNSSGRSLCTELPESQTQPTSSTANRFLSRYPYHCITVICQPAHRPQWGCEHHEGKNRDASIHLHLQYLIQNKFSNYVWWVNKGMNKWVLVNKIIVALPKKIENWGWICFF